jgi:hypothetical protein
METSVSNLVEQGQQQAEIASGKVGDLSNAAKPVFKQMVSQSQHVVEQGMKSLGERAGQARDAIAGASDSIVAYTKKNPGMALGIAAAAGAVMYAALKALTPSRD